MKKSTYTRIPDSKWVYFVYNWGSPIGVFTNAIQAAALYMMYSDKWGNPLPEGALAVIRYRKFRSEDITESIKKVVSQW